MFERLGPAALVALTIFATSAPARSAPEPQTPFDQAIDKAKAAMMGDPQAALGLSGQALALARAGAGDPALRIATAEWLQGEALARIGRPGEALPIIERAMAAVESRQPNSKLQGDLLMSHGGAVSMLGRVELALSEFQRAFDIYRTAGDGRGQAKALQNIGSIYQDAGDYERALKYYAQSAEAYRQDPVLLVAAANNKADAYAALKKFEPAIAEYKIAIGIARQMGSPGLEAGILTNLAAAEVKSGRPGAADADVARGLKLAEKAAPEERPFLYGVAAQAALERGSPLQARQLLEKTFKGVDLKTTTLPYRDFHETAYQTFLRLGDDRQALAHLQAFKRLDDGARAVSASANAALMAARFDFASQDLKIANLKAGQLQRDVRLARQSNTITTGLLGGSGLVLALLAVGFVSIRRSRDEVRAANVKLTDSNTALQKALKAKSDFLAATSHEIRTPLNGILGMTQVLLADRDLPSRQKERIELVHSSGETMRALVDDILDLAKMQTGKLAIEKTEVDLRAILEETGKLWTDKASAKGLSLCMDIGSSPVRIIEDGGRLRQVVFNLLSNAIKFTHDGQVRLSARAERRGR
jgi:signal transduction histidine kinase